MNMISGKSFTQLSLGLFTVYSTPFPLPNLRFHTNKNNRTNSTASLVRNKYRSFYFLEIAGNSPARKGFFFELYAFIILTSTIVTASLLGIATEQVTVDKNKSRLMNIFLSCTLFITLVQLYAFILSTSTLVPGIVEDG